jgi:N-acetylglucosaminyldiphosphoundecaprenol N-acetyl-beta-D-mannosaminyltransferase
MEKRSVLGSFINTGSYQQFLDEIFVLASNKVPSYVCFANVHMVMEAHRDDAFRSVVNAASLVAPDGKPLSLFLKLAEGIQQDRVCGMDMFADILGMAEVTGKSVYFYGTTPELLDKIAVKARGQFPDLKITGWYSPPFRELTEEEKSHIAKLIAEAQPDLVFVSLGCPKQEKWMAENKDRINACLLGLGQAFKVYAGEEKRLPAWMRDLSLEWAYRLYLEPRRLWKRYLNTNTLFLLLSAWHFLRLRLRGLPEKRRHQPAH